MSFRIRGLCLFRPDNDFVGFLWTVDTLILGYTETVLLLAQTMGGLSSLISRIYDLVVIVSLYIATLLWFASYSWALVFSTSFPVCKFIQLHRSEMGTWLDPSGSTSNWRRHQTNKNRGGIIWLVGAATEQPRLVPILQIHIPKLHCTEWYDLSNIYTMTVSNVTGLVAAVEHSVYIHMYYRTQASAWASHWPKVWCECSKIQSGSALASNIYWQQFTNILHRHRHGHRMGIGIGLRYGLSAAITKWFGIGKQQLFVAIYKLTFCVYTYVL